MPHNRMYLGAFWIVAVIRPTQNHALLPYRVPISTIFVGPHSLIVDGVLLLSFDCVLLYQYQ